MTLFIWEETKQHTGFDPDVAAPDVSFTSFPQPQEVTEDGGTVDPQGSGGTVRGDTADSAAVAAERETDSAQDTDRLPEVQRV